MDEQQLDFLIEMRQKMLTGESNKQKEIIDKLDELILAELNKPISQEPA